MISYFYVTALSVLYTGTIENQCETSVQIVVALKIEIISINFSWGCDFYGSLQTHPVENTPNDYLIIYCINEINYLQVNR